jgi:hypothetical protein
MKLKTSIFAALAAQQVASLHLSETVAYDCGIRTKVMESFLNEYEGWRNYLIENHSGSNFLNTSCLHKNVCSYMTEEKFEKFSCCLNDGNNQLAHLLTCHSFLDKCCDSATECCTGDSFPSNLNCCTRKYDCCPGDTFPDNINCTCDSSKMCCPGDTPITNPEHCYCDPCLYCCPGDTWRTNLLCPLCDSTKECCDGEPIWDDYESNPEHCKCDSETSCCDKAPNFDTWDTNKICPCYSSENCCPGDTWPDN